MFVFSGELIFTYAKMLPILIMTLLYLTRSGLENPKSLRSIYECRSKKSDWRLELR